MDLNPTLISQSLCVSAEANSSINVLANGASHIFSKKEGIDSCKISVKQYPNITIGESISYGDPSSDFGEYINTLLTF